MTTKTEENYIEHEVKLRVQDEKFKLYQQDIQNIRNLLRWLIGIGVSSIVIPIILHMFKLV